ncbi:uncharacterized protein K460DRAFT_42314 [Cucurbitaria berberidis CBS 394.84]|uniref:Uncharacterized protein n=1 Tax=Cucurbitaria berberidis CBS 394.84 TaxID=1168544 RepID=A0A9P4GU34_9PLEO|nr:uncharacterized protein K460DRAFT_42314 [Cucurbitaria berberidis CBS 394.84]KAF1851837.1 hypothetical protein K460DRAFT_42314 [Cucurbitaria berberidis CBS 394.84]
MLGLGYRVLQGQLTYHTQPLCVPLVKAMSADTPPKITSTRVHGPSRPVIILGRQSMRNPDALARPAATHFRSATKRRTTQNAHSHMSPLSSRFASYSRPPQTRHARCIAIYRNVDMPFAQMRCDGWLVKGQTCISLSFNRLAAR